MIQNCTIAENYSGYGGGVYCSYGGTIENCIIKDNSAPNHGGGVRCDTDCLIENCLITGNEAGFGGGVYFYVSSEIRNCTVTGNSATSGGGVFSAGGLLRNTIVYGNTSEAGDDNRANRADEPSYAYYCCTTPTTDAVIEIGCVTNEPLFVDSSISNFHLQAVSPCIDAGTNMVGMGKDLAGVSRPLDGDADSNSIVDIGAFEYVSFTADSDRDGLSDGDEISIRGTSPVDINTDKDPFTDYEEMVADTSGTNSNDYFCITTMEQEDSRIITFNCSAHRLYSLQFTTNLLASLWFSIPGQTGLLGDPKGSMSLIDTNDLTVPDRRFYRVRVSLP